MWLTLISVKTSVLWGGGKCILLFKLDSFFISIYDMTSILWISQEGNVLTRIFSMGLFVKWSQDKPWWITSTQMCCLYMCLLHSQWEKRENQPKQTQNTQSMTTCNIYAKSFHAAETYPRAPRCSYNTNKKCIKYLINQVVGFYGKKSISHHITMQILLLYFLTTAIQIKKYKKP